MVRNLGKSSFHGDAGNKNSRLAGAEEKTGGEEAKTESLDNSFKDFCPAGSQRNEAVSGEKHEVKGGFVWFLRQEVGWCAVGNDPVKRKSAEMTGHWGQQQEQCS